MSRANCHIQEVLSSMRKHTRDHCCTCCLDGCSSHQGGRVGRRHFLATAGGVALGTVLAPAMLGEVLLPEASARTVQPVVNAMTIQPVLTYGIPRRREVSSWRSWGGIQTSEQANEERDRITGELKQLQESVEFPMEILPVAMVQTPAEASNLAKGTHDVLLIYAAGSHEGTLAAMTLPDRWNLMFLRHDPGPVYLWYEVAHPRFFRKTVDEYGQQGMDVHDVVVDEYERLAWRLRALHGLKNTLGKKIVCIGGASGWGVGGRNAPEISRSLWKMQLCNVPYQDLGARVKAARANSSLVAKCQEEAGRYLRRGVKLETKKDFVVNAFVLQETFKELMAELGTDALTINGCMGTIMPIAETTACLTLSLLNDEGLMAFCESDFVVIPSGVLLKYIANKPVFLNDPTYPHDGVITLAHCTAPRRMNGSRLEKARILTHFESDYGAAPKVEMRVGQVVTNLVPDFACKNWVGCSGEIIANPFLQICRSQIDVRIDGDWEKLMEEMKGFHWMTSYGDHVEEIEYALSKLDVNLLNVSKSVP